jgi:predicted DNA-binding ribbon-helix-helix protein
MCQVFISADPQLWAHRARSIRLHGVATSIRLENLFWQVLEEIAARDGYTVPQLCTKLYDELLAERKAVDNFSSFLRVLHPLSGAAAVGRDSAGHGHTDSLAGQCLVTQSASPQLTH